MRLPRPPPRRPSVTEFLAKWVAAAYLLGLAWGIRRGERRRAVGLFLASLALLAFEVGVEESLLELTCAALLVIEASRVRDGGKRIAGVLAAAAVGLALVYFALRPWVSTPPTPI
jgi:hypothetical protein